MAYTIFCGIVVLVSIAMGILVAVPLLRHIREALAARRNAREFAATLPAEERPAFWRLYKQRRRTT